MAVDRNQMAELHEAFLAELFGGRQSKASGATWPNQGDGENNRMTTEFAFTWDGKSTRGKGITVDRATLEKIREQAGGNRPALGLRFYDTDDLQRIGEDWILVPAADFGELLDCARHPMFTVTDDQPVIVVPPTRAPPPPAFMPPEPPAQVLHGTYPADLPPPPHELWPCLIVDSRHDLADPARVVNQGYYVSDGGMVSGYSVGSCRVERGLGQEDRMFVNETVINRGQLWVDGVLRLTVGMPRR